MFDKVGTHAGKELRFANPGHELPQRGRALRVCDAIEINRDSVKVDHVSGDGVRGGELILAVGPRLAQVEEGGPGLAVTSGLHIGLVGGPLGKGFVEPEVIPPGHGDKIAKPHMSELMQDRVGALLVRRVGYPRPKHVVLKNGDRPGIFHRARIEFGHEQLVVLAERVPHSEDPFEVFETLFGDREDVVGVEVLSQG